MIYSVHNPYQGGFDYYEAPDKTPINDDHPTPSFRGESKLGVAATRAARPLPKEARLVGHGDLPKGSISSGDVKAMSFRSGGSILPSGLSGILDADLNLPTPTSNEWAVLGALGGAVLHGGLPGGGFFRGVAITSFGAALAYYLSVRRTVKG